MEGSGCCFTRGSRGPCHGIGEFKALECPPDVPLHNVPGLTFLVRGTEPSLRVQLCLLILQGLRSLNSPKRPGLRKVPRAGGDVGLCLNPYGFRSQRRGPVRPETKGCAPQNRTSQSPGELRGKLAF